ncbi:MAG: M20 family metallopeptidase [Bacteroidota bacterium]
MENNQNILLKIKQLATEFSHEAINIRRQLHSIPELAFKEYQTSALIAKKLSEWQIPFHQGIAKTGIVAMINPDKADIKTIALRSDMDALPLNENNDIDYKSTHQGVMHACGHDVHMASLLGVAYILKKLEPNLKGAVKLIFQPSEEKYPGGASVMIKEGVLENPKPAHIFGQHVLPTLEAGKIGLKPGKYMASTDEVFITVNGKGGHAATPELIIDPIVIAAHIIVALQQVVSRLANPGIPTVLSFGRINANGRTNIIPDTVLFEGTFRTYSEEWRAKAHQKIALISEKIAESMGGTAEVFIDKGYPYLVNDIELTRNVKSHAIEYLGADNVVDLEIRMTAEDFAYYSQILPGCFYRLGSAIKDKPITNLHSSTFDVDESCLETGMGFMAWLAYRELEG